MNARSQKADCEVSKTIKENIQRKDIVFYIIILIVLIAEILMPKTGQLVLVYKFLRTLLIWMACVYVFLKVIQGIKANHLLSKSIKIIIAICCVVICIWFGKNIVLDIVNGKEEISLHNVEVSRYHGYSGIFSLHYYLIGIDSEGNRIRLEVSEKDCSEISQRESIVVEYYKHTGGVVKIR